MLSMWGYVGGTHTSLGVDSQLISAKGRKETLKIHINIICGRVKRWERGMRTKKLSICIFFSQLPFFDASKTIMNILEEYIDKPAHRRIIFWFFLSTKDWIFCGFL